MPGITTPKPFVLVLMPQQAREDAYALAIKPACDAAGAYVERVDDVISDDAVLQRIHVQIAKADIVVADMTTRDASTYYETGYAHARNKPVVLLTKSADDIPFDLKHYVHVVHGDSLLTLKSELERRVRALLDDDARGIETAILPLDVEVNGVALEAESTRAVPMNRIDLFVVRAVIYHRALRLSGPVSFQIGLISPAQYSFTVNDRRAQTEHLVLGDERLHYWRQDLSVFPGAFERVILVSRDGEPYSPSQELGRFKLRVLTANGFFDFPFTVTVATDARDGP